MILLAPLHAEIKLQRAPNDLAHGVARVHGHVGHLVNHLQPTQLFLAAIGQACRQYLAVENDVALQRGQQARDDTRQGGFAGARFTHHRQRLAATELHAHLVQRLDFAARITGSHVAHFEQRLRRWRLFRVRNAPYRHQGTGVILARRVDDLPGVTQFHRLAVCAAP